MKKTGASPGLPASELISQRIAELGDWRGETLGRMRRLIQEADPDVVEEWKWMGSPTWSHNGLLAVTNAHKDKVKVTFSHGAQLPDRHKLFNNGFQGNKWRAIDIHQNDRLDEAALKELIRSAIAFNLGERASKQ